MTLNTTLGQVLGRIYFLAYSCHHSSAVHLRQHHPWQGVQADPLRPVEVFVSTILDRMFRRIYFGLWISSCLQVPPAPEQFITVNTILRWVFRRINFGL